MKPNPRSEPLTRRDFVRTTSSLAATALVAGLAGNSPTADAQEAAPAAAAGKTSAPAPRPLLTKAEDFYDVSRGNP